MKIRLIQFSLIYILVSPFFRQVLKMDVPLIRPWFMFNFIGKGIIRVDAYDQSGKWVDMTEGMIPKSFYRNGKLAIEAIEAFKVSHPGEYKFLIKKNTPKGWKQMNND